MKLHFTHLNRSFALGAVLLSTFLLMLGTVTAAPHSELQTDPHSKCTATKDAQSTAASMTAKEKEARGARSCCQKGAKASTTGKASFVDMPGMSGMSDMEVIKAQLPFYPLKTCVVTGEALGSGMGETIDYVADNRLIRLCCKSCKKDFNANPAKYLAKLDAAVIKAQKADYPAKVCPISGQKLGAMGDPHDMVYAGRLVRLCCPGCVNKFKADPATAMATIYGEMDAGMSGKMGKGMSDMHGKGMSDKKGHSQHKH